MTQLFSVIFCVVIDLCINFTLGLLQTTYLTNGDEWREGLAEIEIHVFNPLNAELNPIYCLLALLGAHHFLHVSRIRVKS